MMARASPYITEKTIQQSKLAEVKHQLKARTMDVRRRKYLREVELPDPLTPEYPVERRAFRTSKFTPMNTASPPINQSGVRQADTQSSQEMPKDAGKSISDIDHSIRKVAEKYFDHNPSTSKSRNDIESTRLYNSGYISAAKRPLLSNTKQTEFISEIRTGDDTMDFDFCFEEEAEHQKKLRTPNRNFKIQRNGKSKPKQLNE